MRKKNHEKSVHKFLLKSCCSLLLERKNITVCVYFYLCTWVLDFSGEKAAESLLFYFWADDDSDDDDDYMVYMVFSSVYVPDGITKSSVYKNFFWCYICFAKKI